MTTTESTATRWNEPVASATEVAELRRAVTAMREELDRREVEQMEIEGVVEFLLGERRTHQLPAEYL